MQLVAKLMIHQCITRSQGLSVSTVCHKLLTREGSVIQMQYERCIYTPALHLGPYRVKKQSQAAPEGKSFPI